MFNLNPAEGNLVNRNLDSFSIHKNDAETTWGAWQMFICHQNDAEEKPRQRGVV